MDIVNPATKAVIVKKGDLIDEDAADVVTLPTKRSAA